MVFAPNTERSPTFYYRNQQLQAIDVYTGQKVWTINGIYSPNALAYGILVASDSPNGVTYAFGEGATETTVSVSSKVIERGKPLLIEGTVTDQSTAQKDSPAIADDYMTAWMKFMHMQQPKPTNATGVKVRLMAIDPNGNFQDIGVVTSTVNGNFQAMWTPPVEGAYTITASFEGSKSYYSSAAETAFGVGPASASNVPSPHPSETAASPTPIQTNAPLPSPSSPSEPPSSNPPTTTYIAIGIAIVIIVAAAAALVVRKRKKA